VGGRDVKDRERREKVESCHLKSREKGRSTMGTGADSAWVTGGNGNHTGFSRLELPRRKTERKGGGGGARRKRKLSVESLKNPMTQDRSQVGGKVDSSGNLGKQS